MVELRADNITLSVNGAELVKDASFALKPGELVVILGPNGAGKTSLLRASLGLAAPSLGHASIGSEAADRISPAQRARMISYLPQSRPLSWPNVVKDVVSLGRFSHGATLGRLKGKDAEAVETALAKCDLTHLAERRADTLSGGELSRVHCARAFAAEAPLLVADEPVAALDPKHQFRTMDLIKALVSSGGGALVVLHDIGLAARYATRLIWMKDGCIVADGSVSETLNSERLETIYGIKAKVDGFNVQLEGAL
jgi:iron complex transport system ATP-binding protein